MRLRNAALLAFCVFVLSLMAIIVLVAQTSHADSAIFSDPAFQQLWQRTDQAVQNGTSNRPWMWGPAPFDARLEPYAESPNGERQVQYFDKARMEITNPAADRSNQYYVTNGLLTVELVSGKMQTGDQTFVTLPAAQVPVAGDADDANGPTYATFNGIASLNNDHPATDRTGQTVTEQINKQGQISTLSQPPTTTLYAYFSPELKHNIPDVFWKWMAGMGVPWQFAMGLPITEPYWAQVKVAGQTKMVLMQLFERRVLTFTPSNPANYQVEMGNIGRHYWAWRYQLNPPTPAATPSPVPTPTPIPPVFNVSVSSPHPNVGGEVTVTVKLVVNGQPATNAAVHLLYHKKRSTATCDTTTDQNGVAECKRKVTKTDKAYTVKVDITATYQNRTYTGTVEYQAQ